MEYKVEKLEKKKKIELESTPSMRQLNDYISSAHVDENYNSDSDPVPVVNFDNELKYLNQVKAADIVFIVDATASMAPFMEGTKKWIRKLVRDAQKCMSQYISDEDVLAFALVTYRDHPPQDITYISNYMQLTTDYNWFRQAVMDIKCGGGGDGPEAVVDALYDAIVNIKWRDCSEKFIYHVLDSPPHGTEFNHLKDGFPNGCPCGKNWEEVLLKMRELEIDYTVIKLSNDLDNMIMKFSEYIRVDVATPNIPCDSSREKEQGNC
jgi:hypothetical protein